MWTKAQTSAFQKALAATDKHKRALDGLVTIAKISPQFAESVADLVTLHEHTRLLSETALQVAIESLPTDPNA